jgi:hypothetical protein
MPVGLCRLQDVGSPFIVVRGTPGIWKCDTKSLVEVVPASIEGTTRVMRSGRPLNIQTGVHGNARNAWERRNSAPILSKKRSTSMVPTWVPVWGPDLLHFSNELVAWTPNLLQID